VSNFQRQCKISHSDSDSVPVSHSHSHIKTHNLSPSPPLSLFACDGGKFVLYRQGVKGGQEFNNQAGQKMTRERARTPEALPGFDAALMTGRGAKFGIGVQDSCTAWNKKPMPPLVCPKAHKELLRLPLPAVSSKNMVRCQDRSLPRENPLVGWSRFCAFRDPACQLFLFLLPWIALQ